MGKHILLLVFVTSCSQPQNLKFLDKLTDAGSHVRSDTDGAVPVDGDVGIDLGDRSDAGAAERDCVNASNTLGAVCSAGQGACERPGKYACLDGGVVCDAVAAMATVELCDTERDEDCDGKVDEAPQGKCCHNGDCDEAHLCDRPKDDALAAGTCVPISRPNADCKKDGEKLVCTCHTGYDGDGQTCVRNACVALDGEKPPCGPNQSCASSKPGEKTCSCKDGFADCDGAAENGCEVGLAADAQHCGDCGRKCAAGLACADGTCAPHVKTMSLGYYASLALTPGEEVLGTGAAALLLGRTSPSTTFVKLSITNMRQMSMAGMTACVLSDAGSARCWGTNTSYAIGSADKSATSAELSIVGARAIATADNHACIVTEQGKVFCWGAGQTGEFGDGVARDSSFPGRTFAQAMSSTTTASAYYVDDAVDLHAGTALNCARTAGQLVYCWGTDGSSVYAPELVRDGSGNTLADAVALSGGNRHACALRSDGTVVCWGNGPLGGAAAPSVRNRYVPVGVSDVRAIASGALHVCALLGDGTVRCWGDNTQGQLGTGDTHGSDAPVAVLVNGLGKIRAIFAGPFATATCAELETGSVYCWGSNFGQLGTGGSSSSVPIPTPTEIISWP
jgi:hypothetical protein